MTDSLAALAAQDERTCAVCGQPVAPILRGYLDSVPTCEAHLEAWRTSQERSDAVLEAMQGRNTMRAAFDAWAARLKQETRP